jgi:hypothetical protein
MPTTTKSQPKGKKAGKLSNAQLLQLAKKRKPPQSWYNEGTNPFAPAAKPKKSKG